MSYAPTQEQRFDHARDLRKHDGPRPHDRIPLRLTPTISEAMQICILVKGEKNFEAAAALIEQYAQTTAEGARLQATIDTSERILAQIEGTDA
jgi:hypothetical protein